MIAVDVDDDKLEWAKRQGATHTVNARDEDAVAKIHEITSDPSKQTFLGLPVSGAHYAFDCIGGDIVAPQLLPSLLSPPYGSSERGTAVLVGIPTLPHVEVNPGDLLMNEKRLVGCLGGSPVPSRDFPIYSDWVRTGRLDLDAIVTRRVRAR